MANTYKIAVIPGDGIGPEVISAGLTVLETLSSVTGTFTLDLEHFDWSSDKFKATGSYMPDDFLDVLRPKDAIFFGAVGDPNVPDHISLWSLLLPIRQRFQQYANVRPTRILRGTTSPLAGIKPEDLDWVLVRENSEGEYAGQGGRTHIGQDWEVGTELAIFSRHAIRRIFRFAFQTAEKRPRKLLTFVTKSNAQRSGMVLWDEVAYEVAAEFPHVKFDKMLVDAMTTRMVLHPKSLDTIVATNLHADILSDLAASLAGSIGIAPTSNLDPTRQAPSMFEPVHGSAPDISGKGIANPVATFWTAAEMLDWLGEPAAAKLLMEAVETVTGAGILTKDLGGSSNTVEVTTAVVDAIKKLGTSGPSVGPTPPLAPFASFTHHYIPVQSKAVPNGVTIHAVKGGSGPPLLLLHGYPQTYFMWHKIVDRLAEKFTVVVADLRGYGESSKPPGSDSHVEYSKREMAADQVAVMQHFGFNEFFLVAHDRGARVSHRLVVDHPGVVKKLMLLDICPTLHMYETTDDKFAKGYWHWFFKILPSPYPESVIGSNPLAFWNTLARRPTHSRAVHTAEAVAAYHAAFFKPETIHATCEDYRASATIDLDHDKQDRQDGRKIAVPALRVLWGAKGMMPIYGDVVEVWKGVSDAQVEVTGTSLDCGHYIPEEQSEEVLKEIFAFLL